jgi:hypothetical protein
MAQVLELIAEYDTTYLQRFEEEAYTSKYKDFDAFMKAHDMERSSNLTDKCMATRVRQKFAVTLDDTLKEFDIAAEKITVYEPHGTFSSEYKQAVFYEDNESHPRAEYHALWIDALDNYLIIGKYRSWLWAFGTFDEHMGLVGVASHSLKEILLKGPTTEEEKIRRKEEKDKARKAELDADKPLAPYLQRIIEESKQKKKKGFWKRLFEDGIGWY